MTEDDLLKTIEEVKKITIARETLLMKEGSTTAFQIQTRTLPEAMQNMADIILITEGSPVSYMEKFTSLLDKAETAPSLDNPVHVFGYTAGFSRMVCFGKEASPLEYSLCNGIYLQCVEMYENPETYKANWRAMWADLREKGASFKDFKEMPLPYTYTSDGPRLDYLRKDIAKLLKKDEEAKNEES